MEQYESINNSFTTKSNPTANPVPANDSTTHPKIYKTKSSKNKSFTREFLELFLGLLAYLFAYLGTWYVIFGGVILAADYFDDRSISFSSYITNYFIILFAYVLFVSLEIRRVGLKKFLRTAYVNNTGLSTKNFERLSYGLFLTLFLTLVISIVIFYLLRLFIKW